jgi:hypothetical protein
LPENLKLKSGLLLINEKSCRGVCNDRDFTSTAGLQHGRWYSVQDQKMMAGVGLAKLLGMMLRWTMYVVFMAERSLNIVYDKRY